MALLSIDASCTSCIHQRTQLSLGLPLDPVDKLTHAFTTIIITYTHIYTTDAWLCLLVLVVLLGATRLDLLAAGHGLEIEVPLVAFNRDSNKDTINTPCAARRQQQHQ